MCIRDSFELKDVKDESLNLHVSYVGYKTQTIKVKADRKKTVTIKLEHDNQLRDVTIYAPSEIGIRSSQMSANELLTSTMGHPNQEFGKRGLINC